MSIESKFIRSFKEGVKGEFTDYMKWLTQFGFDVKKGIPLKGRLDIYSFNMFVNREEEIEKIGKIAGFFSTQKDINVHISITAPTGYGKTTILETIRNLFLKTTKEPLKVEFIESASMFQDIDENGVSYLLRLLERIGDISNIFILIDHCEEDFFRMKYNISEIFKRLKNVFLITCWSNSSWYAFNLFNPTTIEEFKTIQIKLKEFSEKEVLKIIIDRLLYYKITEKKDTSPFGEDVIKEIVKAGVNNPGFCFKVLNDLLEIAHKDDVTQISEETLRKYIGRKRIDTALKVIEEFDGLKLNILLWILRSSLSETKGINTEAISENIGRDRTTIIPHLKKMLEANLISYQKIGREVFYKINDFMLPFVESVLKERLEW